MKKYFLLLAFILCISFASAWQNTTFNNSLGAETLTFTSPSTIQRFLSVPQYTFLINGQFNFTYGIGESNVYDGTINHACTTGGGGGVVRDDSSYGNQLFNTTIKSFNVTKLAMLVYRAGAPGIQSVGIYAANATGNPSTLITINRTWDANVLTTDTDGQWVNITLPSTLLANNTRYVIFFNYSSASNPVNLFVKGTTTDCYPWGQAFNLDTGGGYDYTLTYDRVFALYGEPEGNGYLNVSIGGLNQTQISISNATGINTTIKFGNLHTYINNYLGTCSYVSGYCNVPFNFTSTIGGIQIAYHNMTFSNIGFIENSQSYSTDSFSSNLESFSINISYDSLGTSGISAILYYNNTAYSGTKIGSGDTVTYNVSLYVPFVNGAASKTFYWNITMDGVNYSSASKTQNINPLLMDNCSAYPNKILSFHLFDEDARGSINGTIEATANIYALGTSNLISSFNASFNYTGNNANICMSNLTKTYSMDYVAKYYNGSYATEYKNAQRITLSNTTSNQNVSLYDLLSSRNTPFRITVQGSNLASIAGAVVDVQRKYVSLNQFISVESPLTDSNGITIANLVAKSEIYNFVVSKDGVLLGTFDNQIAKCQNEVTSDCRILLNIAESGTPLEDYTKYGNVSFDVSLDKANRLLTFNYLTLDGLNHQISWRVLKQDGYSNNTICTNSASGTSGTFLCTIAQSYGNTTLIVDILDSTKNFKKTFLFSLEQNANNIFGKTGIVLAIIMYSTLSLLMIAHPAMLIFGAILGMIMVGAFHLVDGGTILGNTSIIIWFVIAGGIILFHLRSRI